MIFPRIFLSDNARRIVVCTFIPILLPFADILRLWALHRAQYDWSRCVLTGAPTCSTTGSARSHRSACRSRGQPHAPRLGTQQQRSGDTALRASVIRSAPPWSTTSVARTSRYRRANGERHPHPAISRARCWHANAPSTREGRVRDWFGIFRA